MLEELNWVRWMAALLVVALAMMASFYALRRVRDTNKNWLALRITARVRLSRHAELMLIEVDGKRLLIGATAESVTKIATLDNVTEENLERVT